jgi:hypothetical protein
MRLINTKTFALSEFFSDRIPEYAILSHTWGEEEVIFQDWNNPRWAKKKKGFAKIDGACNQARADRLEWIWVDTNCIDKTSSAELTEAINSMFAWYARSAVCYAYLSDVSAADGKRGDHTEIRASRWFSRGWTL